MNITEQIKKEAERRYPYKYNGVYDGDVDKQRQKFISDCNWLLSTLQVPVWVSLFDEIPEHTEEVFIIGYDRADKVVIKKSKSPIGGDCIDIYQNGSLLTSFLQKHEDLKSIFWLKPSSILPLIEANQEREALAGTLVKAQFKIGEQAIELSGAKQKIEELEEKILDLEKRLAK